MLLKYSVQKKTKKKSKAKSYTTHHTIQKKDLEKKKKIFVYMCVVEMCVWFTLHQIVAAVVVAHQYSRALCMHFVQTTRFHQDDDERYEKNSEDLYYVLSL